MDILWKLVLIYILIGVAMGLVGGAWRPLAPPLRTRAVMVLQVLFLALLWLPAILWHLVRGTEGTQA